ncbi:hypothetical protein [Pleionea sediminis]|uniref:hypothetical protein n=1 Tax=Pleionea sediminis TaxID=2569479 RepID=UPI001186EA6D|nr:hypothetical protein [Pleionea sediminis]
MSSPSKRSNKLRNKLKKNKDSSRNRDTDVTSSGLSGSNKVSVSDGGRSIAKNKKSSNVDAKRVLSILAGTTDPSTASQSQKDFDSLINGLDSSGLRQVQQTLASNAEKPPVEIVKALEKAQINQRKQEQQDSAREDIVNLSDALSKDPSQLTPENIRDAIKATEEAIAKGQAINSDGGFWSRLGETLRIALLKLADMDDRQVANEELLQQYADVLEARNDFEVIGDTNRAADTQDIIRNLENETADAINKTAVAIDSVLNSIDDLDTDNPEKVIDTLDKIKVAQNDILDLTDKRRGFYARRLKKLNDTLLQAAGLNPDSNFAKSKTDRDTFIKSSLTQDGLDLDLLESLSNEANELDTANELIIDSQNSRLDGNSKSDSTDEITRVNDQNSRSDSVSKLPDLASDLGSISIDKVEGSITNQQDDVDSNQGRSEDNATDSTSLDESSISEPSVRDKVPTTIEEAVNNVLSATEKLPWNMTQSDIAGAIKSIKDAQGLSLSLTGTAKSETLSALNRFDNALKELGDNISNSQNPSLQQAVNDSRKNLENVVNKHQDDINNNSIDPSIANLVRKSVEQIQPNEIDDALSVVSRAPSSPKSNALRTALINVKEELGDVSPVAKQALATALDGFRTR